ncbi:PTS N-acetylgalactosamine transporter subunit IID [Olsenella sp. CA-Schmier-601-WT-1]|uniref:PTS N-acetylgalactosamine transporter subunit IID n=2 Tax=Olsenella porci TaxID=2652279 RepID=A0A6N7XNI4_9ACTN|nr:PTS N-acetylgalactosamine transporter subunit IID [Olsenella porci]
MRKMASNDKELMDDAPAKEESGKILTNADITKMAYRTIFLQASFNYERMQAGGWLLTMLPYLKRIYKDDPQGLADAMSDNLEFINTSPHIVGFLNGLVLAMEEAHQSRDMIRNIKVALFPPLAGIGDAIFWFTLLPILAGICSSMAMEGSPVGPILFFLVYLALFLIRPLWARMGYGLGVKAIGRLKEASAKIGKAATVLGCTVLGGLIASYVSINIQTVVQVNENAKVAIQTDVLDKIFPNMLAFGYVFLMYYFIKKRQANPVVLILVTFGLSILLSFFGIL